MEIIIQAVGEMIRKTEKVFIFIIQMEKNIADHGGIMKGMEKVNICIQLEKNIMASNN